MGTSAACTWCLPPNAGVRSKACPALKGLAVSGIGGGGGKNPVEFPNTEVPKRDCCNAAFRVVAFEDEGALDFGTVVLGAKGSGS